MTLLSMSLNAQFDATKKVAQTQQTAPTGKKVDTPLEGMKKASKPAFNRANRAPSRALETATLDLFDTTTYVAEVLPIYGYWHDATQHNQMIYPASLLTDMAGSKIKSMTFYPASYSSSSGINFRNGSVTFKLMEVNGTTGFAESNPSYITGTMTTVKTVSMPSSANTSATTWLIEFDQEYEYNGGDLVIDVTNTKGNYGHTYFYVGTTTTLNVNYPGLLQYSSYDAESLDFVPQVSFTYEYDAQPKHDLAIALSAPTTAAAGSTVTLTATVTNNGDYDENGYTVTFTANGTTINTQTGGSLAQGASATFTYTYTTTDAQGGTNVNFGASVACTDDAVATNNEATASTSVLACPPPENVAATPDGNSGTMTWTAPIIGLVPATLIWDFEEEADFTAFTTIDSDGDGYNWAWHYNDNTSGSNLEVHSGNGQIYSQSYDKATSTVLYPDNWLISPEVTLGGTLSFWACGQDPNQYWNEVFAVYVCVGSYNGVSDFIKISPDITTTHAMTEYSYDLSQYQGQGYFAIRHYNVHDEFYLVVDDITLETMLPGEQPTSYNIYLDGQLEGNVDANTFSYTFNNLSNGTYNCAVSAVYSYGESVAVPATFTTQPKTEAPSISYETVGDNVVITATGNGTVTLTIPGYPEASGTGSASITVPRHMQDYTVTATATAQEADHLASDPTTQQVPIPGLASEGGWMLMEGTYTNGSDQLSFTHRISDNVVEPILFVDQFYQSTRDNRHPNEYLYKVSEKVSDDIQDARETSEVPVHVHKTYSKLNAIYTEAEILADKYGSANELRPNVINGTMSYDITAESDIYFYGLYRGNRGEEKPDAVDDLETNTYRISKIQKDLNEDFFNENMLTNAVVPKYNHIEAGDVERIDKEYVDGVMTQEQSANNFLAYVPVIWSYGNHTHRPVGNNSYGSDIKVTHLGNVSATVGGFKSDGSATGEWEYNGTTYCVYTPIIDIYGIMPEAEVAPDGDTHAYEPYMYRVWCLYEGARNFKHAPNDNGHESLADNGELHAPFLIGEVRKTDDQAVSDHETIGAALEHMDEQAQWSFGAPAEEGTEDEMEFVIRFYYKKTVTDAPHYTDGGDNGGAKGLREGDETNRQFYVVETRGTGKDIQTAINEMFMNGEVVSRTYVNAQGMQSDVPFDGLNIVITRYSDGTTSTTKVVR